MFDNYKEFEEIVKKRNGNDEIDLRNLKLNPTTALPLLCRCKNQNLKFNGTDAYDYLINLLKKDILFSNLPKSRKSSDELDFITNYMENLDSRYGGYFALRTVIAELANNVFDHSKISDIPLQSYIYSQTHESLNKLDVCVIDDGFSIPRLFEECGVSFSNDCQAIEKAIGTFSTISDNQFERGNGLWTIIRLVCEGNHGELLIVSRAGCLHIFGENYRYYLLEDEHIFNGTLVSVRLNRYEIQNIYDLIEFNKPDSYKLGEINDY